MRTGGLIVGVFTAVSAVVATPLATLVALSFPAPSLSAIETFFLLLACALLGAVTGSLLVHYSSHKRRFAVLDGIAASVVAWFLFAALTAMTCAVVSGSEAWVFGAFVGLAGLAFFPFAAVVLVGGAFAGWLINKLSVDSSD